MHTEDVYGDLADASLIRSSATSSTSDPPNSAAARHAVLRSLPPTDETSLPAPAPAPAAPPTSFSCRGSLLRRRDDEVPDRPQLPEVDVQDPLQVPQHCAHPGGKATHTPSQRMRRLDPPPSLTGRDGESNPCSLRGGGRAELRVAELLLEELPEEGGEGAGHEEALRRGQLGELAEVHLEGVGREREDVELDELLDDVPHALDVAWGRGRGVGCGEERRGAGEHGRWEVGGKRGGEGERRSAPLFQFCVLLRSSGRSLSLVLRIPWYDRSWGPRGRNGQRVRAGSGGDAARGPGAEGGLLVCVRGENAAHPNVRPVVASVRANEEDHFLRKVAAPEQLSPCLSETHWEACEPRETRS